MVSFRAGPWHFLFLFSFLFFFFTFSTLSLFSFIFILLLPFFLFYCSVTHCFVWFLLIRTYSPCDVLYCLWMNCYITVLSWSYSYVIWIDSYYTLTTVHALYFRVFIFL